MMLITICTLISLLFYPAVCLLIDQVSRKLYPEQRISGSKRRVPKLPQWRFLGLYLANSAQTGFIIGLTLQLRAQGWGGLYAMEWTGLGAILLFLLQIFCILAFFDMQYYWFHRLFHSHLPLYHWIHAEHHEVRFPNVWHLHYQSPLEWFLTTTSPMLILGLLPIPLSLEAWLTATALSAFINVGGHAGHEITRTPLAAFTWNGMAAYMDPKRRWLARWFNNVLHHDLHHQRVAVNYSLYFTWWDRIGGTMDKSTDEVHRFINKA